jgi:hypothetical protein
VTRNFGDNSDSETINSSVAPSISLPKGGGALKGIGEKFTANPVDGTAALTVPIAFSPGRSGFGPQLSLSYNSGSGNGPFGFGWKIVIPSITRKTDKGIPRYCESDEFILAGAEDLVPVLVKSGNTWTRETLPLRKVGGIVYHIQRYRPRQEGLFARIECWSNTADATDVFWRSISKDNITTWYGRTQESRIADPGDRSRIFSWLISESYDDKGNLISYGYKAEDLSGIDTARASEHSRGGRSANRYIKRIRYGNHAPYLPKLKETAAWPAIPGPDKWLFEAVFDYGEHDAASPASSDDPLHSNSSLWPARQDPFSSCRWPWSRISHRR